MIVIPDEIKRLYRADCIRKNIRIHFPNGERADIVNCNIVEESFSFTESICSQERLKYGLCEANVVKFETVGIGNIKNCEIQVSCEIDISSLSQEFISEYGNTSSDVAFPYYSIPFGVFIVDSCQRQADMKKRKVVAYGKEIHEELFLNPVEAAKFNGGLYCNNKDPYCFNVFAFLYANVYKEFQSSYFSEKEDIEIGDDSTTEMSTNYATGFWYVEILYKTVVFFKDEKEFLYELEYESMTEEKIKETAGELFETLKEYEGFSMQKEEIETLCEKTKEAYFLDKINYSAAVLKDCHYIYPYMGYSNVDGTSELYRIMIPYGVRVVLREETETGSVNTEVKSFIVREKYGQIACHKIGGFPQIYMKYERIPETKNAVTRYYLSGTDVKPRSVIEAVMEFMTVFGRYGRDGIFRLFRIEDDFGLYPSENLYPSEELFPRDSNAGILAKSRYQTAWYDDELTKPYGRVSVTYKNEEEKEVYAYYALVDEEAEDYEESRYQTYSLSENYLIKNAVFTVEQIEEILKEIGENIKNIRYMPADIELIGLPWVEAGDVISVITDDGAIETCILRRTLTGIQALNDNFESKG